MRYKLLVFYLMRMWWKAEKYIKTKDEYKNYIDSLLGILGEDELNDLIYSLTGFPLCLLLEF